jgi:predicted dehydrogenase
MTVFNSDNILHKPILVIGAGSIGERHIRNLWSLGYTNLYVYRQRNLPFRDIGEANVKILLNWEDVEALKPFACIIATPTSQHITQVIACIKLGSHVLVEKPLSHNLEQTTELLKLVEQKNVYLRIAYMQRFHPLVKKLKQYVEEKTFGNLLSITAKWGDYLPAWHPWEDYRQSYAAKRELGGGVALTLSHEIDIVNWLAQSKPLTYFTLKNYSSKLEMDVESGCDILIKYENGLSGNIQLNYFEKTPERYVKLVFDEASVSFEYFNNLIEVKLPNGQLEKITANTFDRNDMFLEQTAHFFQKTSQYKLNDSIEQIEESIQIIKICNHE